MQSPNKTLSQDSKAKFWSEWFAKLSQYNELITIDRGGLPQERCDIDLEPAYPNKSTAVDRASKIYS